jgi:predicted secreted protein
MKRLVILLISISLFMAACGGISTATPKEITVETLATTDPEQPIEVNAGNEFNIVVQSNPSTGYHWDLMGEPDANVAEFVSKDYKADEPVLIGSGGVDIWVFKAVNSGETTILLGYYPPSNDVVEPEQTLTLAVIVK